MFSQLCVCAGVQAVALTQQTMLKLWHYVDSCWSITDVWVVTLYLCARKCNTQLSTLYLSIPLMLNNEASEVTTHPLRLLSPDPLLPCVVINQSGGLQPSKSQQFLNLYLHQMENTPYSLLMYQNGMRRVQRFCVMWCVSQDSSYLFV